LKLLDHHEALKKAQRLEAKAKRLEKKNNNSSHVAELKKRAAKPRRFHDSQRLLPFK
jgi:hypothetical protein